MADIVLSSGVRSNLLQLQRTADLVGTTQNRLATGKKVNSALDNPTNFFTASALNNRASDLSSLLDSMSNAIKTIEAADNGLKSITKIVENMQGTVRQARQDKTAASVTPGATVASNTTNSSTYANKKISFSLSGGVSVDVATHSGSTATTLNGAGGTFTYGAGDIYVNGTAVTLAANDTAATVAGLINAGTATHGVSAVVNAGQLELTNASGNDITLGGASATLTALGFAPGSRTSTNGDPGTVKTIDEIVSAINSSTQLAGQVRASKNATTGVLELQNLTTSAITGTGLTSGGAITGATAQTFSLAAGSGGGISDVRKSLVSQFNELRTQLDKLSADSGYNGINLLNGDELKVIFNESSTSSISVKGKKADGTDFGTLDSAKLGINAATNSQFQSDTNLDTLLTDLNTSLTTLRTQASQYGSALSVVQNRQDFTKSMINTLKAGSDNLVLADTNEEAANMLALQTRQQLATTALSLASQADQGVLRLF